MTTALRFDIAAWILFGLGLIGVLKFGLLSALLGGFLVYGLVHYVGARLSPLGVRHRWGKLAALALISFVIIAVITFAAIKTSELFSTRFDVIEALIQKMIDSVELATAHYPEWARDFLPANSQELYDQAIGLVRSHAGDLRLAGESILITLAHLIIGMVIGGLAALGEVEPRHERRPLTRALAERGERLGQSFRRVLLAQVRISALNTALTAIYLVIVLPAFGVELPFVQVIIVITFIAGLMPIIGNLISNTVIVLVSFNISLYVAIASLGFLIAIHKLEYFVNARIIGSRIFARAWELLLAMLVMEALFGVPGVIAAPFYYAYLKDELSARRLV